MRVAKSGTLRRCCGRGSKTEKSMTDSTLMVRMAAFWTQSERRKEGQTDMARRAVVCQKHTTREDEKGRRKYLRFLETKQAKKAARRQAKDGAKAKPSGPARPPRRVETPARDAPQVRGILPSYGSAWRETD